MKDEDIGMSDIIKYGLAAIAIFVLLWVALSWMGVIGKVATAPSRVISKTLETDNIIHNYEWFHETHAAWLAKVNQIGAHNDLIKSTDASDKQELSRLRIEVSAMKQVCRKLATDYNANSVKVNVAIFKGKTAPERLTMIECEQEA